MDEKETKDAIARFTEKEPVARATILNALSGFDYDDKVSILREVIRTIKESK